MRGDAASALEDLLAEITALSLTPPSAEVEAAHLSAMTGLAREIARLSEGASRPPILAAPPGGLPAHRRLALGLVAPVVAAPLCVVAIALAGVSLPSSVRAPLEAAGVSLPNQSRGDETPPLTAGVPAHHWSAPQVAHRATWAMKHTSLEPAASGGHHAAGAHEAKRGQPDLVAGADAESAAPAATPAPAEAGSAAGPQPHAPQPPAGPPPTSSGPAAPAPMPAVNSGGGGGGQPSSGLAKPSVGAHPVTHSPLNGAGAAPSLPVRPGEGCGDSNHLHLRVGKCN